MLRVPIRSSNRHADAERRYRPGAKYCGSNMVQRTASLNETGRNLLHATCSQAQAEFDAAMKARLDELEHHRHGAKKALEKAVAKWKDGEQKGTLGCSIEAIRQRMVTICFRALKENRATARALKGKHKSVEMALKKFLLGKDRGAKLTLWSSWKQDMLELQPALCLKPVSAMPRSLHEWRHWSIGDIIAGTTIAVTSLPQYIAYAELAGLSGYRGIAASGPPLVFFAFLTGNPCLSIGVTSITALMAISDLKGGEYKELYGEEAWENILGTYSVMVGVASVVLAMLGAAQLVKHIPGPVKAGWKLGFALCAFGAQAPSAAFAHAATLKRVCTLPHLHGAPLQGGAATMYRLGWTLTHPHYWDAEAVLFSAMTLLIVTRARVQKTQPSYFEVLPGHIRI
eukprot:s1835_g5.t1